MTRLGLKLLVTLVAGGALASAAASASAAQWYVNGSALSATEAIEVKALSSLVLSLPNPAVNVLCDIGAGTGSITSSGKGTVGSGFEFSQCSVIGASGCIVPALRKPAKLKSQLMEESGKVYEKFEPESGTELFEIYIEECVVEDVYTLKGSMRCEVQETNIEALSKECYFTRTSGSKLQVGSKMAELEVRTLSALAGADKGKQFGVSGETVEEVEEPAVTFSKASVGEVATAEFTATALHGEQNFVVTRAMPDPVFQVSEDGCSSKSIPSEGKCDVKLSFSPLVEESHYAGSLEVVSEEVASPKRKVVYSVPLEGES